MSTPKSVIDLAKKSGAKMVDIKFVDTFGTWQHFSCPIRELSEEIFSEGLVGLVVDEKEKLVGIVTKMDLVDVLTSRQARQESPA